MVSWDLRNGGKTSSAREWKLTINLITIVKSWKKCKEMSGCG